MRVILSGADRIPKSVSADGLCEAILQVGAMLGVAGTVKVEVSLRTDKTCAFAESDGAHQRIVLYDRGIRAKRGHMGVRTHYAHTLAHELVHLAQYRRQGEYLIPPGVDEDEAYALERVYGPVVERYLKA